MRVIIPAPGSTVVNPRERLRVYAHLLKRETPNLHRAQAPMKSADGRMETGRRDVRISYKNGAVMRHWVGKKITLETDRFHGELKTGYGDPSSKAVSAPKVGVLATNGA